MLSLPDLYIPALVLNLLKDIPERSKIPFNKFRASAKEQEELSGDSKNKNITEDSFVQDGYEDLIECLQTDIAVIESKLQKISVAKSLAKAAAAVAGIGTLKFTCLNLPHYIIDKLDTYNRDFYSTPVFTRQLGLFKEIAIGACTIAVTYVALNLYDTFKTKNELQKALALDKEFLVQLIGFKEFAEKPLI